VRDGKLAGLIMSYDQKKRVGEMLPYPIVKRFLDDCAEDPYAGVASAGFTWTKLIDPAKRAYLNLNQFGKGVLVLSCLPNTGAADALRSLDVILECDGHSIDDLGFYEDPEFGRLSFTYLVRGRRPGDVMPMTVVRGGKCLEVGLRLGHRSDGDALIPENVTGLQAEYLVSGGFIIRELTGRYLHAQGSNWQAVGNPRLVHLYLTRRHEPTHPGQRIVLLSGVLPDAINIGYQHFRNEVIESVNGRPISNIADALRIIDKGGSLERIRLRSIGVDLVLDQGELAAADNRLKHLYRIPKLRHERRAMNTTIPPTRTTAGRPFSKP